ncbi:MAG: TIGR02302 family protein [Paracoccaceae bacterium]|nr:TIGR02302 family protein [Paracoccaceae bacterium]
MASPDLPKAVAARLRRPLVLTRMGIVAERLCRAFWPFWSILFVAVAALMLGAHDALPLEAVWGAGVLAVLGAGAALWHGVTRFRWPSRADALERLDATLPGHPIAAVGDTQAVGAGDAASEAVWAAHVRRMEERLAAVKAAPPDLKLSARDPYALRYVAAVALVMALLFGSVFRAATVTEIGQGGGDALAAGPAWEGWVEPPLHTGRPSLYLNNIEQAAFSVPDGSRVTIRLYGEVGALSVAETVSGRTGELPPATEPTQSFTITQVGEIEIAGPGGRSWDIRVIPDNPPEITADGPLERTITGELRQPFSARDDYGVEGGTARIVLDLVEVDRRYGLQADPDPRDAIVLDLPMPIAGDRAAFSEVLTEDLAEHPWAGLPVTIELAAEDAREQVGSTGPVQQIMPGRRFFDPLAQAIVEQRRDLLWARANAPRVASMLRAVSYRPDEVFTQETAYLKLRVLIRRLEAAADYGTLTEDARDEMAAVLWDIALLVEEGDLSDALERLRRAQDRLAEAIENGATDEEIAELMQELREAMQDYMRQLAEQSQQDPDSQAQNQGEMQEMTQGQLEDMLQELQRLMEEGRMEEAQRLLEQLRQMMENMQVTQGPGQGQQSPGQQALQGLAETLREQQDLSDEAFRDLQDQFNPGQQGQQQGEGQPGQEPGQGQNGEQQFGEGQGQGQQPNGQPGQGQGLEENLADRQRALRQELRRQTENLPGAGTPEGDAARDNLGRAGEAMDGAEEALREEDFAGALDRQSEAIEALREGMRDLAEQLAEQQQQAGQQGQALGEANPDGNRDPLGREAGQNGRIGTDEELTGNEDVYRRAREILDEIRRRSSEQSRPDEELDYLRRLLDRF